MRGLVEDIRSDARTLRQNITSRISDFRTGRQAQAISRLSRGLFDRGRTIGPQRLADAVSRLSSVSRLSTATPFQDRLSNAISRLGLTDARSQQDRIQRLSAGYRLPARFASFRDDISSRISTFREGRRRQQEAISRLALEEEGFRLPDFRALGGRARRVAGAVPGIARRGLEGALGRQISIQGQLTRLENGLSGAASIFERFTDSTRRVERDISFRRTSADLRFRRGGRIVSDREIGSTRRRLTRLEALIRTGARGVHPTGGIPQFEVGSRANRRLLSPRQLFREQLVSFLNLEAPGALRGARRFRAGFRQPDDVTFSPSNLGFRRGGRFTSASDVGVFRRIGYRVPELLRQGIGALEDPNAPFRQGARAGQGRTRAGQFGQNLSTFINQDIPFIKPLLAAMRSIRELANERLEGTPLGRGLASVGEIAGRIAGASIPSIIRGLRTLKNISLEDVQHALGALASFGVGRFAATFRTVLKLFVSLGESAIRVRDAIARIDFGKILQRTLDWIKALRRVPGFFRNVARQIASRLEQPIRQAVARAQELGANLGRLGAAAARFTLAPLFKGFVNVGREVIRVRDHFHTLRRISIRFYDTIQQTRLVFGNIRVLTGNIGESLAKTVFTGVRNIGRGIQGINRSLRTPGGFLDSFRSTDGQLEKINNRLRDLDRRIAAPTSRVELAQARFNLIEAKTNASLAKLNRKIGDLDTSAKLIKELQDEIESKELELEPLKLQQEIINNIADAGLLPLRRELEKLTSDFNLRRVDLGGLAGGQEKLLNLEDLKETRHEIERIIKILRFGSGYDFTALKRELGAGLLSTEDYEANLKRVSSILDRDLNKINALNRNIDDIARSRDKELSLSKEESNRLTGQILLLKQRVIEEKQVENRRLEGYKNARDLLERRLTGEKEILDNVKREFNVTKAQIDQERTLLNIRQRNLKIRQETGAGADTISGAVGDTFRSAQQGIQSRQLTSVGNQMQRVSDNTENAMQHVGAITQQFEDAGIAAGQFNAEASETDAVLQDLEAKNRGLLSSLRANVSEFVSNPLESVVSIGRIAARNVVGLAENTISRVSQFAISTSTLIGKIFIKLADGIGNVIVKTLELIPILGGAVAGIYDLFRDLVSGIGEILGRLVLHATSIIRNAALRLYNTIRATIEQIAEVVEGFVRGLIDRIASGIQTVASNVATVFRTWLDLLRGVGERVLDIFSNFASGIGEQVTAALEFTVERAQDFAKVIFKIIAAPFRFIGDFITSPFRTLRKLISDIGNAIRNVILLPLRPIGTILSAPIRALGFVFNAFNYNTVPETTNNLKKVQKEGAVASQVFERVSKSLSKTLKDNNKINAQALKAYRPIYRESEDLGKGLVRNIRGVDDVVRILTSGVDSLTTSVSSLRTGFSNLGLGLTVTAAVLGGVLVAAKRASQFKGIILAFRRTGVSLQALRTAAGDTVRDIDLMRSANIALSQAVEPVRVAFAEHLPRIMEIARAQAVRTGESTKFLFESITAGIKRSSPKLIDNTGLVIKIGRANELYAEKLNKANEELIKQGLAVEKSSKNLTATESQLALLEEVLRAGTVSVKDLGKETEGAQQKVERFIALLSNLADRITFGLQPALEGVLNFLNGILKGLDRFAVDFASILWASTTTFIHGISRTFSDFGKRTRQFIGDLLRITGIDATTLSQGVTQTLENIFFGAVRVFGSLAGAIAGIWDVITGTITGALQDIANMLIGQSPPKEGPLRNIDQGARAVMEAWQKGFVSVDVKRVEKYAERIGGIVNNVFKLTGIPRPANILKNALDEARKLFGDLSEEQLEERIRGLDRAIEPFEKRLEIIRQHFDAIQKATEFSLNAINKRVNSLLQAVVDGSSAAAAEVRQLDDLYGRIKRNTALEQQRLENAAISIELLKAQQAEERTYLELLLAEKKLEDDKKKQKKPEPEEPPEPDYPEFEPVGNPFVDFLNPDTADFTDRAKSAFDAAYNAAKSFITGEQEVPGLESVYDEEGGFRDFADGYLGGGGVAKKGNVFERFFASIPDTLTELPTNVENFLTDVNLKIIHFLETNETVLGLEDFLNNLLGLKGDQKIDFSEMYKTIEGYVETIKTEVKKFFSHIGEAYGINKFIRELLGVDDWDLGEFIVNLPFEIITLPKKIVEGLDRVCESGAGGSCAGGGWPGSQPRFFPAIRRYFIQ